MAPIRNVAVRHGVFSTKLGPFDYGDMTVGLEHGVGDSEYGPIAVVDNAVSVCAQFATGADIDGVPRQPDPSVRDAVGANGEELRNSPQKEVFGSLTPTPSNWLEVVRRVSVGVPQAVAAVAGAQGQKPKPTRLNGFCFS